MRKVYFLMFLGIPVFFLACSKDPAVTIKVPAYLTGKLWTLDTIIINPPLTFDALDDQQKFDYTVSLAWFNDNAQITFNNDGSVTCSGDWDFGYTNWQLQNNDADLRMTQTVLGYDTLRSWQATANQFSYEHAIGSVKTFDCTLIYR